MTAPHPLLLELEQRWQAMFTTLAAGGDVAPTQRLRAEGLMEALVLTGAATAAEVTAHMDRCYRQACGQNLAAVLGDDWQEFFAFPQIPAMMHRAPVYPSTKD